jgi:niacin transporter
MITRKIIYTALFASIGIILPQFIHIIGGPSLGPVLLPIHLPVFIGAMLLGSKSGVLIAVVSLFIGFLIGMPPYPIIVFMFFEMIVYGLVSGYLYYKLKLNIFVSLISAKVLGMATALITINIALSLTNVSLPPLFGSLAMFTVGLPGIVIQLIIVPIIVLRLKGVYVTNEGLS